MDEHEFERSKTIFEQGLREPTREEALDLMKMVELLRRKIARIAEAVRSPVDE